MNGPSNGELGIDVVLQAPPPRFEDAAAVGIGRETYGIDATGARNLGSERDQTFMLLDASASPLAVLKVSNPAEDPDTLDMEALAAFHVHSVAPELNVAQPRSAPGSRDSAEASAGERARASRIALTHDDQTYWVRAYDVLPGRARLDPRTLSDQALIAWGETTANLGLALRAFMHPRALRTMPWDVQHAPAVRPMLGSIADGSARRLVEVVLDRFDDAVSPRWNHLRAQAIHSDLTADNVLADSDGRVVGIIDFGDLSYSALVVDLASVLDSLALGRPGEDMFRVARLVLDGYERRLPLEPLERELMGELWAARAAVGVAIGSWRAERGLEEPDFAERLNDTAVVMMEQILTLGWRETARRMGAEPTTSATRRSLDSAQPLVERRAAAFGPAMEPLSYDEPLEMAHASGVWMTSTDGNRYLDAYNNVVCLGHSHPRVTGAVARQWRVLNTNMRYLHPGVVELAERMADACPDGLDTVLFVNSGSEANDIAWRIARHHTGRTGGVCTAHAYHGITEASTAFSPESTLGTRPSHVATWQPPDAYRRLRPGSETFVAALAALDDRGLEPAATILDGVLQSEGVLQLEAAYVQELVRLTHAAGALWIADEVQGGHGRTGESLWSFERFGIVPDLITLGKPMGNGQPVGAVITRRDLVAGWAEDTVFFSTFGGNQVSVAAAHAVLDVLEDERVLPRVVSTGELLRGEVQRAGEGYECVGDVRGIGLANGIEIVTDRASKAPDPVAAAALKEGMRRRGVLVGTTGPSDNVLKVRPPLAFGAEHVPVFVRAFEQTLADMADMTS